MKTQTKFKAVNLEDLAKEAGPELLEFLLANLHTAVHEDEIARDLDKPEKSDTSE